MGLSNLFIYLLYYSFFLGGGSFIIFGGASYWSNCFGFKGVGLDKIKTAYNKNETLKLLVFIRESLLSERYFTGLRIGGLLSGGLNFGEAYYRNFTVFHLNTIRSLI